MKTQSFLLFLLAPVFFVLIFFFHFQPAAAATFVVNSTLDTSDLNHGDGICVDGSGNCTLRGAIEEANVLAGPDSVHFNVGGGGLQTIIVSNSDLPTITTSINLDATTQPGYSGMPLIELKGVFGLVSQGFFIDHATSVVIKGFVINSFQSSGIILMSSTKCIIENNFIGTDVTGILSQASSFYGLMLFDSIENLIKDNLISGNLLHGILIVQQSDANIIQGNKLGTDISGMNSIPNYIGIGIFDSKDNIVGGSAVGSGNLISGNSYSGLYIFTHSENTRIEGNKIGTNILGTGAVPNLNFGMIIYTDLASIGGSSSGEGNVISGNGGGILLFGSSHTTIQGNKIGTDITGMNVIGNDGDGILMVNSEYNLVGGVVSGEGNLISGNGAIWVANGGININGNSENNIVQGNKIGTDVSGMYPLGNAYYGIIIYANFNTIGGSTSGARNLISGNLEEGLFLASPSESNIVNNNYIGTDITGNGVLPNQMNGVLILSTSFNKLRGNLISGNGRHGIKLSKFLGPFSGSNENVFALNRIGTNSTESFALPNAFGGISLSNAERNRIGVVGAGNVIAGNIGDAIAIDNASNNNEIYFNSIGINSARTILLPNSQNGVVIFGSQGNRIGGSGVNFKNFIVGNGSRGVFIGSGSEGNTIRGNSIAKNNSLGISLQASGPTPNDNQDIDTGSNQLQNYPVFPGFVETNGTGTMAYMQFNSAPNQNFILEFFTSAVADPSGYGEGESLVSTQTFTTDANGNLPPAMVINLPALPVGRYLTATATDINGNTSEFSRAVRITSAPKKTPGDGGR